MICSRQGCDAHAKFQIGVRGWLKHQRKTSAPTEAFLGLCVCADHKRGLKVSNVITQAGIDHLNKCLESDGKKPINPKTLRVTFHNLTKLQIYFPKELFVD
jgi:hypothetical protein